MLIQFFYLEKKNIEMMSLCKNSIFGVSPIKYQNIRNMKYQNIPSLFLLSLILWVSYSSCRTDLEAKEMTTNMSNYIYAYTSNSISKADPIRIQLTSPIGKDLVGTEVDKSIFSFKPSISGTAQWQDEQTIVFQPKENLPSGQHYLGKFILSKVFKKVPSDAKTFEFNFFTKEQHFFISVEGLKNDPSGDEKKKRLSGWLNTADIANSEEVEKLVTARQDGNVLPIIWEHKEDNIKHTFIVENIQRGVNRSEVEVSWDGKPLGLEKKSGKKVEIPALDEFKVMDAKVVQGDNPYIVLYFSDPLSKSQDLTGLISLVGKKRKLKYMINGSEVSIYPQGKSAGVMTVKAALGIKSATGYKMKNDSEWKLVLKQKKPRVRLVGNGVIMPNSKGLMFPFDAVNLNYIDVEIIKIFNNNVLQFLQNNEVDGWYNLNQVGRIIMQKQIQLSKLNPDANAKDWTHYALDLSDLIKDDPHAIYQVSMGIRPEYSTYNCDEEDETAEEKKVVTDPFFKNDGKKFKSIWNSYRSNYKGYRYEHRNDPCFPAYYSSNRFVRRNVLASDMGILVKRGSDASYMIAVTDLRTTQSMESVNLEFYDYQQQLIKSVITDNQGMAVIEFDENPFVVIANKGNQRGYLKLMDQNSLPLGRFDVGGKYAQKGLKGFMYGERGVWRPGDSIFLNFILEDKTNKLPKDHPITFELYDVRGTLKEKRVVLDNVNKVYALHTATSLEDPTGNWRAIVKVGGASFTKNLKIETVKPNRLKINMDFGKEKFTTADAKLKGDLQVNWLHGAPASNLTTKVEMHLTSASTYFKKFKDFRFSDPTRRFSQQPKTIYDGPLDENGFTKVEANLNVKKSATGKIRAAFKVRAFEKGGDASADQFSVNYDPFDSYVGVKIPRNKYHEQRIDVKRDGVLNFVAVDGDGNALIGRKLNIGLYRVKWRWWWDSYNNDLMQYNSSNHKLAKEKTSLVTDIKGKVDWKINVEEWGRYMVRVCDEESGHCSGSFFYAGYPWYDDMDGDNEDDSDNSNANQQMRQAAAMLSFVSDKEKYSVGNQVKLNIPASESGRCLVSIENGSRIIETYWIDAKKGDNEFTFIAQPDMTPTVYAHVTLIQPHAQVQNDLPIRMYGVVPIHVEDKKTRLYPKINMPSELKPEKSFALKVFEENGKAMTYTVAIVDDGLLDLTRFKTPDPWKTFYAREALGVKTWDVYDQVLGAYGGKLESILSIGGDDELEKKKDTQKANRFKPVVVHLGPFYLEKGETATHNITMPNYIGSVRAMVVASKDGAYGNTEQTAPVRKPLMLLATLPRVLGPSEELKLPINIFAMDKKVKNVNVKIEESSGLAQLVGGSSKNLTFSKIGDQLVTFDIKVKEAIGVAKFKIIATGSGETATQEIEIQVRNPNPYVTEVTEKVLQPGDEWTSELMPIGVGGTNNGTLEISNIPPINLDKRLRYLIRYPHGCVEQTTSGAFPQLYVSRLLDVDEQIKKQTEKNIRSAIKRLKKFQTSEGGMSYWAGNRDNSDWGTSYAGHFLLEAKKLGYELPLNMENRWVDYQSRKARQWTNSVEQNSYYKYYNYKWRLRQKQLDQSYRLYVLALSGNAELGAMNQMREIKGMYHVATWRLAAAYALAGKPEVAEQIIVDLDSKVEDYRGMYFSYGSGVRDEAMILETLTLVGDLDEAGGVAKRISKRLSSGEWFSTQTIAYSLIAIGKFVGDNEVGETFNFKYKIGNSKMVNGGSSKPMMQLDVPIDGVTNRTITTKNDSKGILYVRAVSTGQPLVGDQKEEDSNLRMSINYRDMKGKKIDPSYLVQGTDFVAEVTIDNPGYRYRLDEMALTQVFPSGWEIHNSRMSNMNTFQNSTRPEYQDIRDDRVLTYFDIYRNREHTYRVQLNASYQGKYYLPTTYCEAMYDNDIYSRIPGKWVKVGAKKQVFNIEVGDTSE